MAIEFGPKDRYRAYGIPSLDIPFADRKSLVDRISGNNLITFTRAQSGNEATYVGSDGLIKTASANEPRFDHDPLTGESLGLLVEEARTNPYPFSNLWGVGNSSSPNGVFGVVDTTSNYGIAPDGTQTSLGLTLSTSQIRTWDSSIPNPSGENCFSFFVKPIGSQSSVTLSHHTGINIGITYNFNTLTSSGTVSNVSSFSHGIIKFPNNWYRVYLVFVAPSLSFWPSLTESQTIEVWGKQLEAGSFPTSYIPTTTATVTRTADVATLSNTNSSIYPTSNFTIINQPYGTSGGGTTLKLVGPRIKRTSVYSSDLSQTTINSLVNKTDQFWQWRVLGSSFALPNFTTNGSVTVDWGDGVVETLTTAAHTFTNGSGYHDIGFRLNSGTYFRPAINNNATYAPQVIAVGPAPVSMKVDGLLSFRACSSLRGMDGYADYTGGTSLANAWESCASLALFPLVNTAGVTNFSTAWTTCSALTSFPLINTASATRFDYTWKNCTSLTSFPLISTGAVADFSESWSNCNKLTSFPLINIAATTSLLATWKDCSSLTSFPLINTAAVTSLSSTWQNCSALSSFPLINTAAVTNFSNTWQNCSALSSFPLINTAAGTNFSSTWQTCPGLTSFPLINVSAGTNFTSTWQSSTGLTAMPALTFNSATTLFQAWTYCSSLATFPANAFNTTGTLAANAFSNTFTGCALTAQSIENILTSLVTNGQSSITLGLSGATNANTSTWSVAAKNAYITLVSRGWTITQNGTAPT